jgi:hypothetical protein
MITFKEFYLEETNNTPIPFNSRSNINEYNIGPVYHGGGWNGVNAPLIRDGELGTGVYFTDSKERALSYTQSDWKETQGAKAGKRQHLIEARIRMRKPIILEKGVRWPPFSALVQLGMKPERADNTINRAQERTGNTGSCIRTLGEKNGYDGIIFHREGDIEYVVWQPFGVMVTNIEIL